MYPGQGSVPGCRGGRSTQGRVVYPGSLDQHGGVRHGSEAVSKRRVIAARLSGKTGTSLWHREYFRARTFMTGTVAGRRCLAGRDRPASCANREASSGKPAGAGAGDRHVASRRRTSRR